jgi:mxaK protein
VKRRTVHLIFGATALLTGILAGWQTTRLWQAERVNAAIAAAGSIDADLPEAQFAQALVLSRGTDGEAATRAWKALIAGEREDLRQGARYNLGNLHLREALAHGEADVANALPLVELAKQRYRDALRERPDDWDARYNLERALWLAPEIEQTAAAEEEGPEPPKERVVTTLQGVRLDLP